MPYALGVANVDNHEELVIRPAAPIVMATGVYAGMTLPDNGQPMLLLDAGGIAQAAQLPLEQMRKEHVNAPQVEQEIRREERYSALHFEELTGEDRLIRLSMVERVEDLPVANFGCSAGRAYVRIEGRLLPCVYPLLPTDAQEDGQITCLRVRDGVREICYPVKAISDIFEISSQLDMIAPHGHVAGLTLVDGRRIEVVDGFALFAGVPEDDMILPQPRRCVIIDGEDSWNREILMPLLVQAGYEVSIGIKPEKDDIVLSTSNTPADADVEIWTPRTPVIYLRPHKQPRAPDDTSIYRYDRDAVLQAIASISVNRKSA
jgi:two-component system chemotaxis sensor kinase CheA